MKLIDRGKSPFGCRFVLDNIGVHKPDPRYILVTLSFACLVLSVIGVNPNSQDAPQLQASFCPSRGTFSHDGVWHGRCPVYV
jgi:hypothetical protein